ncbi:mitochondrial 37S ribosomal protein mS47 Ecym_2647 [Eremothecium cymbalariae DBVPG|uniref:3-hydroxyisobutyryl-CoA hydrolase n=1 Tax=Eremothecium cymbalariae (strain CBS 270.75 / DBVPG 7215 / KCTC 17166 / NRRL Y-17582) TaxID=931890 RepID=G8JNT3_ERECY|nr:Hypothetical protein Ecym_2647 [Eremothecium cymbalariae DBVPG\
MRRNGYGHNHTFEITKRINRVSFIICTSGDCKTMLRQALKQLYNRKNMSSVVEFTVNNTARRITLNRSKKLNALDYEMCAVIFPAVQEYAKSDVNNVIIIDSSSSPRAFCAGGDVAALSKELLKGNSSVANTYFQAEYSLNWLLATMEKPVVAIMDGITMGGGVGLCIHVPFRVATENTLWAMPESAIGLFADVGTTFGLPRVVTLGGSECQLGYFVCITGDILSGADAYVAGLASHYVDSAHVADLQTRLGELQPNKDADLMFEITNKAIGEFSTPLPKDYKFKYSAAQLDVIEKVFRLDTPLKDVFKSLEEISASPSWSKEAQEFAKETRDKLSLKSIVSMEVTREQFRRNFFNDIQTAMKQDLITATNMCNFQELTEFAKATSHKLLERKKTPYNWEVKDISMGALSRILSPNPENPVSLLDIGSVTFKKYMHHEKFILPNEDKVQAYIVGSDQSGRSMAVTKPEAIRYFTEFNPSTKGKVGVEYIVGFIIDRKCETDRDGFLKWKY